VADRIDVLIVGAGSAGSVLAERLSADPGCRVVVLETGPGLDDPAVAALTRDGTRLPIGPRSPVARHYDTLLTADPPRHFGLARGAVLGGSGAVNGGYFCRGLPADYDGWGVPGWGWREVAPHFAAVETDLDFPGPPHGTAGPVPVRRTRVFSAATEAFLAGADRAGLGWIDDLNGATEPGPAPTGVAAVPLNIVDGVRTGAGAAFLQPALGRPNLAVHTGVRVLGIAWRGTRAVGVHTVGPDGPATVPAERIVLCAGAIGTAHLLQLSGVGPAALLTALGIRVVADLPVGQYATDHPEWVLPVRWPATAGAAPLEAIAVTADGIEIRSYTKGFGAMTGAAAGPADPPHLAVAVMRPAARVRVRPASADPWAAPVVEHRYDAVPEDLALLRRGLALAAEIAGEAIDPDEAVWSTAQHLAGTAPMGTGAGAVLDERCRVRGVDGLWVVDGSVLPALPGRGPHATIVAAAHRAAEFIA